MKCKLLIEREVMEFQPGTTLRMAPPALVAQCERRGKALIAPIGTIVDDPECWRIVLMGQAEAADDECRAMTKQTDEERAMTLHAASRLAAGIIPDDFELFDSGVILGYNADGSYKPGPHWDQRPAAKKDDALQAAKDSDI